MNCKFNFLLCLTINYDAALAYATLYISMIPTAVGLKFILAFYIMSQQGFYQQNRMINGAC